MNRTCKYFKIEHLEFVKKLSLSDITLPQNIPDWLQDNYFNFKNIDLDSEVTTPLVARVVSNGSVVLDALVNDFLEEPIKSTKHRRISSAEIFNYAKLDSEIWNE